MLPNMGFGDWVIILVLVLLLFGAKRLPELARAVGQSMTAFKKGMQEDGNAETGTGKGKTAKRGKKKK